MASDVARPSPLGPVSYHQLHVPYHHQQIHDLIGFLIVEINIYYYNYSTAQWQLDTHKHAAGLILSGIGYIMRSIFKRAPVMFMPSSGKSLGIFSHECYTRFE